jgi:predicted Fe-S protein YdhL (DUF1289 family)
MTSTKVIYIPCVLNYSAKYIEYCQGCSHILSSYDRWVIFYDKNLRNTTLKWFPPEYEVSGWSYISKYTILGTPYTPPDKHISPFRNNCKRFIWKKLHIWPQCPYWIANIQLITFELYVKLSPNLKQNWSAEEEGFFEYDVSPCGKEDFQRKMNFPFRYFVILENSANSPNWLQHGWSKWWNSIESF